jgi:hypothetical protein
MAESTSRLSLDEVRASVNMIRNEGERLVGRIRHDALALVDAGRKRDVRKLQAELRERAEEAVKDIRKQRTRLVGVVEELLARLADIITSTLKVVRQDELAAIGRRLVEIERRLEKLTKHKAA